MKALRIIRNSILTTLLTLLILLGSAVGLTYFFQDKIIQLTLQEFNKYLAVKIEIDEKIEVSILEKFPEISVRFSNVRIYESIPGSREKLAVLGKLYFTFDAYNFLNDRYIINQVFAEQGNVHIKIDKTGQNNYSIIKTEKGPSTNVVELNLEKIQLSEIQVYYTQENGDQFYDAFCKSANAKLHVKGEGYFIGLESELLVNTIKIGESEYFKQKEVKLISTQEYHTGTELFKIHPSTIVVEKSEFQIAGEYENTDTSRVDLKISGKDGNIQTLLSLLPQRMNDNFSTYKSSGTVYFHAAVKGLISERHSPLIDINFGFKNASFFHPDINERIENASLTGTFSNGQDRDMSSSYLKLNQVNGVFEGKRFSGNFVMKNFNNPYISFDAKGSANAASVFRFYPIKKLKVNSGKVDFDITFEGRSEDMHSLQGAQRLKSKGELIIKELSFDLKDRPYPFKDFYGDFVFNKNDVAVSNFKGKIGRSDFLINGYFKKIIGKLIFNKGSMWVEADLSSNLIDLDELLSTNKEATASQPSKGSEKTEFNFPLIRDYNLSLDCNIKKLKYYRFKPGMVNGAFEYNHPRLGFRDVSMNIAGGKINFTTLINIISAQKVETVTQTSFTKLPVDSIFSIFDNFDQDFITEKNLRGDMTGNVKLFMNVDQNLNIDSKSVISDINLSITNGQLNNFEPMKKLSRFIDEDELANIRFSELRNDIFIENRKISIPEMEIKSNISNINISGIHTFDQEMDYKLKVPLSDIKKERQDRDEAFGAIEDDGRGHSVLFLTIKGNSDNYKIAYDKKRTTEKIKQDLKKEKVEFKELFKKKEKQQEIESQPEKEPEFFEF